MALSHLLQRLEVAQMKCDNVKETERLTAEHKEMTEKYENLKISLETSRSSMMQVTCISMLIKLYSFYSTETCSLMYPFYRYDLVYNEKS